MPRVRDCFPRTVTAEKIERILPGILADSQTTRRPDKLTTYNLTRVTGVPVARVDGREADDFGVANCDRTFRRHSEPQRFV